MHDPFSQIRYFCFRFKVRSTCSVPSFDKKLFHSIPNRPFLAFSMQFSLYFNDLQGKWKCEIDFPADYLFLQSIKTTKNTRTIIAATRPVPTAISVRISCGSPSDDTIGTGNYNTEMLYLVNQECCRLMQRECHNDSPQTTKARVRCDILSDRSFCSRNAPTHSVFAFASIKIY